VTYAKQYFRYWRSHTEFITEAELLTTQELETIVESLFAAPDVQAGTDYTWDMDKDGIVTAQDYYLDQIASDQCDFFNFSEMEAPPMIPYEASHRDNHIVELFRGRAVDSIGTLHQGFDDLSTIHPELFHRAEQPDDSLDRQADMLVDDEQSVISQGTSRTIQSAVTAKVLAHVDAVLDTKMSALQETMINMIKQMFPNQIVTTAAQHSPMGHNVHGRNDGNTDAATHSGGETGATT
jgi:hypothetical protein